MQLLGQLLLTCFQGSLVSRSYSKKHALTLVLYLDYFTCVVASDTNSRNQNSYDIISILVLADRSDLTDLNALLQYN